MVFATACPPRRPRITTASGLCCVGNPRSATQWPRQAAASFGKANLMQTIFNTKHLLHQSPGELTQDGYVPAFEKPERAEIILKRLKETGFGPVREQIPHDLADMRIHDAGMVTLLQSAADEWVAAGRPGGAVPFTLATRGMREDRFPQTLDGRLSDYCFDAATPLTATSWEAIQSSADTALTGADIILSGRGSAFSLCRPPGHHAGSDHYGGYCFLNNAAIAAQKLLDNGANRVAILDVDYHHGNGTQQIFYSRYDVLVVNLHADPDSEYPFCSATQTSPDAAPAKASTSIFRFLQVLPGRPTLQPLQPPSNALRRIRRTSSLSPSAWIRSRQTQFPNSSLNTTTICTWAIRLGRSTSLRSSSWKAVTPWRKSASTPSMC